MMRRSWVVAVIGVTVLVVLGLIWLNLDVVCATGVAQGPPASRRESVPVESPATPTRAHHGTEGFNLSTGRVQERDLGSVRVLKGEQPGEKQSSTVQVSIRIVDRWTGIGVAGAVVCEARSGYRCEQLTGPRGESVLSLPSDEIVEVRAWSIGTMPVRSEHIFASGAPHDLVLAVGGNGRVLGYFQDSRGRRLAAARVVAVPAGASRPREGSEPRRSRDQWAVTSTDQDGQFRFAGLGTPARYDIYASTESWQAAATVHVDTSPDVAEVTLVAEAKGTLVVLATDFDGRRILPDVSMTGTDGVIRWPHMIPSTDGSKSAKVWPDRYKVWARVEGRPGELLDVSVSSGMATHVTAVLRRGVELSGLVQDVEGRPVPGCLVWGEGREHSGFQYESCSVSTSADGTFGLDGLDEEEITLWVSAPVGINLMDEVLTIRGPSTTEHVVVTLQASDVRELRVVPRPPASELVAWFHANHTGCAGHQAVVLKNGNLELVSQGPLGWCGRLPPEDRLRTVVVRRHGWAALLVDSETDYARCETGRLVEGQVTARGSPVATARVSLSFPGTSVPISETLSNEAGRFKLRHVPGVDMNITIRAQACSEREFMLSRGSRWISIELESMGEPD